MENSPTRTRSGKRHRFSAYREQHVQDDVQNPQRAQHDAEQAAEQLEPRDEGVVVLPVVHEKSDSK